ncbi:MAG: alkaline phosphatase family protein [Thermoanaerobaculia bacterium]
MKLSVIGSRLSVFIAGCLVAIGTSSQPITENRQPTTPSLIVVISVDQLRYDYLERFSPWFTAGGFNRFLKSGATFPNTHFMHAAMFTGPGYATIGSGKNPSEHGVVGNTWFERGNTFDPKRWDWFFVDSGGYEPPIKTPPDPALPLWFATYHGSPRYCVYDDSVTVSAGTTTGMSPRWLIGDGLGDRVKAKYADSRVIGIALKDRASALTAGRKADAAYWFDQNLPGFVSSTYYRFDPKIFTFNQTVPGYVPGSKAWNLSGIIPAEDLRRVTFDPPEAWPLKNTRYGGTFPHPIKDIRALTYTPYGNDLALDFALFTITAGSLGTRTATPDVVFVGLSSTDFFGHYYGPDSMEAADGAVRLDRSLERFLDALDRRFGNRVLVALTADHGVQSNPEILKLREPGADAGRIDLRNPYKQGQRISDLPPSRIEIERQLAARLGVKFSADAPYGNALVFFFEEPSFYINMDRIRILKLDPERVKRALRDVFLGIEGVDEAWTDTELRNLKRPSPLEQMVLRSYLKGRAGDVLVTLRPNWIWTWGNRSTTHGQPVENDTHVPLLFWGTGVKSGRYNVAASPADLARTIGAAVGVEAGGTEAKVLPALEDRRSRLSEQESSEIDKVLRLALKQLDPSGEQTLIAGRKLSAEARDAAARLRNVIESTELPAGSIRVDSVVVNGDRATVQLWTGPIPKAQPGQLLLACGTGHTYAFEKRNGQWLLTTMGVSSC